MQLAAADLGCQPRTLESGARQVTHGQRIADLMSLGAAQPVGDVGQRRELLAESRQFDPVSPDNPLAGALDNLELHIAPKSQPLR